MTERKAIRILCKAANAHRTVSELRPWWAVPTLRDAGEDRHDVACRGAIRRRWGDGVETQARLGELDGVLVAVCNRHVDERVAILTRRRDLVDRRRPAAEGG